MSDIKQVLTLWHARPSGLQQRQRLSREGISQFLAAAADVEVVAVATTSGRATTYMS